MEKPSSRVTLFLVVIAVASLPTLAGATNLLQNAGFDTDLSLWIAVGATAPEWNPVDQLGDPTSGSALLVRTTAEPGGGMAIGQCFPVTPGEIYVFGADGFIPDDPENPTDSISTQIRYAPGPNCTGGLFGTEAGDFVSLKGSWAPVQGVSVAPATASSAQILLRGIHLPGSGTGHPARARFDNAFVFASQTCATTATALCLNQGRFRAVATWEIPGAEGFARAVPLKEDSGLFWFFTEDNIELVVKVLNACTFVDRYWVFAAGLTNVHVVLRVRDTWTDEENLYQNPPGTAFQPLQDTTAFATCP